MKLPKVLFLAFLLTPCATFDPTNFNPDNKVTTGLNPGDVVRVETSSGQQIILKIIGIDELYIYASDRQIAITEIRRIEKSSPSLVEQVGQVVGAIIVIYILIYWISGEWAADAADLAI